jgi:cation:H+ antiporter
VVLVGSIAYAHSFESLASRLGLSQGLAGAVVSPLFTSLPELVVFVTAVVSVGGRAGAEVGMGTVIGEPLMLSTLMTPLVVAASKGLSVDRSLARPYLVFVAVFPSVLLPPLLANHSLARVGAALALLASYVVFAATARSGETVEPGELGLRASIVVLMASVAAFYLGSHYLVNGVIWASGALGLTPLAVSTLAVPAVTTLPEVGAALVWARRGLGTLAASSLVGEQVVYATIYPAVAVLAVPWALTADAMVAVLVTEVAAAALALGALRGSLDKAQVAAGLACFVSYLALLPLLR